MSKFIPLLVILILPGCQGGPYPVDSPYYRIPVGSQLVIKQKLTIPANSARIYLQNGRPVTPNQLDQYHAHCWFLSWKRLKNSQPISPDDFVITRVRHLEEVVFGQGGNMLAANKISFVAINSSPTAVEYKTELIIESKNHPDIRRLVCNHWEDPIDARHLTVPEMNKTLGEFAKILPKTSKDQVPGT